jgi:FkbM family methyltransferase
MTKLHQYWKEICTCIRLGARWSDRLRLVAATLDFHVANLAGLRSCECEVAVPYRVRLGTQAVDLWLRRRTGDFFILHEIFTCAVYSIPEEWAGHVATVVDLGANVGLTTLFVAQTFPDARYVCVEPNPANAAVLRRNVAWLGERAEVIEVVVTDHSGQIAFDDARPSYDGHIAVSGQTGRMVQCCTLDEIVTSCDLDRIDLIKIDIEGAEREVVRSSAACLRKVKTIIIELHGDYSLSDFEKDVTPLGFTVVPPGSQHGNAMVIAVARPLDSARPHAHGSAGMLLSAREALTLRD